MSDLRDGDNSANTPRPVVTTVEEDFAAFEMLPKAVRLVAIECRYGYDAKQLLEMYRHFLSAYQDSYYAIQAVREQLRMNDEHTVQKEMEIKWNELQQPISALSNSQPRSLPTKRTAPIVYRSGIALSRNGSTLRTGRKAASMPEFDLFGTGTKPLKTPTIRG